MAAEIAIPITNLPEYFDEKEPAVAVVETPQDGLQDLKANIKDVSEEDWVYPYPTDFVLGDHPIDDIRDLRVSETFMEGRFYPADGC